MGNLATLMPEVVPAPHGRGDRCRTVSCMGARASSRLWTTTDAVCETGHVIVLSISNPESEALYAAQFCPDCGGKVLTRCKRCGHALETTEKWGIDGSRLPLRPRDYCRGCAAPHQWIKRVGLIDGLILAVGRDETLQPAERVAAVEQLEALKHLESAELGTEREHTIWRAVKGKAGPVWRDPGVQRILGQVLPPAFHGLLS
jgi:hypothetical protein